MRLKVTLQEQWQLGGSVPEFYERYRVPRLFRLLALLLLERVPLRAGQRVLDVACGTGIVARLVAPRIAPKGTVVGLDLNEGMLAVARAHALEAGAPIEWKRGDASELPFTDATFDVVLCQQGLQFFPDKPGALREMRRVLVPGGILALNVFGAPNRYNAALAEAIAKYADEKVAMPSLAPFALGDVDALRAIVSAAGFADAEIRTSVVTRRVEPSQEWLLQDTGASPYANAISVLDAAIRAAMIRDIAAALKNLWDVDSFAVPCDVHFVYARK
jgi:ubiquinone/menaquinone biosynthesis C-methylase UbiE